MMKEKIKSLILIKVFCLMDKSQNLPISLIFPNIKVYGLSGFLCLSLFKAL